MIDFAYNGRRQNEAQTVSTLGGATDGAVRAITRTYDSLGRPDKITSHGNVTSDPLNTANITSQVVYAYNSGINKVSQVWQSHEGAAVTSGMGQSPYLLYLYDETASTGVYTNGLRLKDVYPPSNNFITYDYGTSGGIDDLLHRVQNLKIKWPDASTKTVVTYAYNGTGRIAKIDYPDADVRLNYWGSSESDDNYEGLDRFGRVRKQRWEDYGISPTDVDRFDYTHDYVGNRLTRDIPSGVYGTDDQDQVFTYDDLYRVTNYDEGTLSGSSISGTPDHEEDWTLDALGNWTDFIQKTSGTTDLDQDRTHNDANEISTITATTGTNWADPTQDAAGNVTAIPKPSDLANSYDLTYDAWNRLVKVEDGATTVATCEYDGRNYRIIKDDQTTVFHYFYNENWQCLEVRENSDTAASEQFFWGTHYIDALAVRYWDSTGDGDFGDPAHHFM